MCVQVLKAKLVLFLYLNSEARSLLKNILCCCNILLDNNNNVVVRSSDALHVAFPVSCTSIR